jgi:hypothetical protein
VLFRLPMNSAALHQFSGDALFQFLRSGTRRHGVRLASKRDEAYATCEQSLSSPCPGHWRCPQKHAGRQV